MFRTLIRGIASPVLAFYRRLNALTNGVLDVLVCAIDRFGRNQGTQAAASMAYYFIFSMFPLLLLLISVGSTLLEGQDVQQIIVDAVTQVIPSAKELILDNIGAVLAARGAVNVVSSIGLLWSASGLFSGLSYNVNRFWPNSETSNVLTTRLAGLALIGLMFVMLIISTLMGAVFGLVARVGEAQGLTHAMQISATLEWVISALGPWLFRFVLFFVLYRWVPSVHVGAKAAIVGALVAAFGWDLVTTLFTWFLSSGLINYSLVYGSLGAIVGLLFWTYLVSMVIFFSAALTSAIDQPPAKPLSERSIGALGMGA